MAHVRKAVTKSPHSKAFRLPPSAFRLPPSAFRKEAHKVNFLLIDNQFRSNTFRSSDWICGNTAIATSQSSASQSSKRASKRSSLHPPRDSPLDPPTVDQEPPRERLLAVGANSLSVSELLAILIRSGRPGESAILAGQKLVQRFGSRLTDLCTAGRRELKSISAAIEKAAYCQIMAGIELGRRIAEQSTSRPIYQIATSTEAIAFCQQRFERLVTDGRQEEFHIVTLDTKNQVIDSHQITKGTLDSSLVHPREVYRAAIRDAASSVILVHNHPSGDPTPSREDFAVTKRLEAAGELIGIDVLDHVVLGMPDAISIREQAS